MCQNETAIRSMEESSNALSGVSTGLESQAHEAVATAGGEPSGFLAEAANFLDGMSSEQLLAVLGVIGLLIVVTAWFVDGVRDRIEWEIYWRKNWWQKKRENLKLLFRTRGVPSRLELASGSSTNPSNSFASALDEAKFEAVEQTDALSPEPELLGEHLADELARASEALAISREAENQTRSELTDAKEQLRLLVRREEDERTLEASKVETLEDNLADQATQIKKLKTSLNETAFNADQLAASLQESNARCQKLDDELVAVKCVDEKSKSDLADATKEIEALSLKAIRAEDELQTANEVSLDQENLVDRLREECTALKSSLKRIENQCSEKDVNASELLISKEKIQAKLQVEIDKFARANEELEALRTQATRSENELQSANEGALEQANLADRWREECTALKSSLEKVESRCAEQDDHLNDLSKTTEEVQARLQEEIDHLALVTKEFDSEIVQQKSQLANSQDEIARLKFNVVEQAKDAQLKLDEALAMLSNEQKLHNQLKEAAVLDWEELSSQALELSEQEARIDLFEQQATESEHKLAATLAMLSREKSSLAESHEETRKREAEMISLVSKNSELQRSLESVQQHAEKVERESEAIREREGSSLAKSKEETQKREAEMNALISKNTELQNSLECVQQHVEKVERESAATLKRENSAIASIKEEAQNREKELSVLVSQNMELQSSLESVKQHAERVERESAVMLGREDSSVVKMKEDAQKRDEEMSALVSKNSELQDSLESAQQHVEKVERESAETLELLKNEQELQASTLQELGSSKKRVDELEKEAIASSVTVASHNELVRKLVAYRGAYRKSKALIDGLVIQKSEMSDLATEYLAMARTVGHELDEERETKLRLQSELDKLKSSESSFDDAEVKRRVDQITNAYALDLKSQFEQKIKKKNGIIRELQKRQDAEPSIH